MADRAGRRQPPGIGLELVARLGGACAARHGAETGHPRQGERRCTTDRGERPAELEHGEAGADGTALLDERARADADATHDLAHDRGARERPVAARDEPCDTNGVDVGPDPDREELVHHRGDDRGPVGRREAHAAGPGSATLSISRALGNRAATIARAGRSSCPTGSKVASSTTAA